MNIFKIVFLAVTQIFLFCIVHTKGLTVKSVNAADGTLTEQDLIEYIEEGKYKILKNLVGNTQIQQKAVMVLGLSGTGNTTLVNYLNDIALVSDRVDGVWLMRLKS